MKLKTVIEKLEQFEKLKEEENELSLQRLENNSNVFKCLFHTEEYNRKYDELKKKSARVKKKIHNAKYELKILGIDTDLNFNSWVNIVKLFAQLKEYD